LKMKNMPKSSKRPERPYGGVLCSACTRKLLKSKVRA
jgi:large subunit ribosomal protein L34e